MQHNTAHHAEPALNVDREMATDSTPGNKQSSQLKKNRQFALGSGTGIW
jgi:hypothetical protein